MSYFGFAFRTIGLVACLLGGVYAARAAARHTDRPAPLRRQARPMVRGYLQVAWRFGITPGAKASKNGGGLVCTDLNSDGKDEVLVAGPNGGVVLNGAGKRKKSIPLGPENEDIFICWTASGPRIISFSGGGSAVTARDTSGKVLWKYRNGNSRVSRACAVNTQFTSGDAIAVGYDSGEVRMVNGSGKTIWRATGTQKTRSISSARMRRGDPASVLAAQDTLWIFNGAGKRGSPVRAAPDAVFGVDLDRDGLDEIISLSSSGLCAYNANGKPRWTKRVALRSSPLAAPIAAGSIWPGWRQIALGSPDGTIAFFSGLGEKMPVLQTPPGLRAIGVLRRPAPQRDALVILNKTGVTCYEWREKG